MLSKSHLSQDKTRHPQAPSLKGRPHRMASYLTSALDAAHGLSGARARARRNLPPDGLKLPPGTNDRVQRLAPAARTPVLVDGGGAAGKASVVVHIYLPAGVPCQPVSLPV